MISTLELDVEKTGLKFIDWLVSSLPEGLQLPMIRSVFGLLLLGLLVALLHFGVRRALLKLFEQLGKKAKHSWYEILWKNHVPQRALFMLPLTIFYYGIAWVSEFPEEVVFFSIRLINSIMILVVARSLNAFIAASHEIYQLKPNRTPIKSYIQLSKIVIYSITLILIIAQIANESPWYFLSGIGALTAIVLLVFRDTLLSLVASIQLTNNDLIRVGDWIEMPQFGADGDVIDIALNAVRVQNWDKTITTIPTHKFLEHSFKNWRGMQESGGRRIMRSISIDVQSIRFLTLTEVEHLKKSHNLKEYITAKLQEVSAYNQEHLLERNVTTNARWLTNIGTFRAYVFNYLKNHPQTHKTHFTMVRQLEPGPNGLPLQIYVFTASTSWAVYEQVQADIFDHLFAIMPEFGLRPFQNPSAHNFDHFVKSKA